MFLSGKSARKNTQTSTCSFCFEFVAFWESFLFKVNFLKNKTKLQHRSVRHFADGAHSLLNILKHTYTHISYLTQQGNRIHIYFCIFSFWIYFCFVWDTNIGNTNLALIAFFVIVLGFFFKNAPMTHEIQMGAGSGEK